ncbi:MAG: hypothetical protein E7253_02820 [Lachnospiraceae bacterium]|nr:hypothetical protein [Lachnospiraceae bacterium]
MAVLSNIEYEFITRLTAHMDGAICLNDNIETLTIMIARILEFIQTNQNICFLLKTPSVYPVFRKNVFREIFRTSLMMHPVFEKYNEDILPYAQTFILYGCGHVIDAWLNEGCAESPQVIAGLLADFITRL